jgi:hypothetical protein
MALTGKGSGQINDASKDLEEHRSVRSKTATLLRESHMKSTIGLAIGFLVALLVGAAAADDRLVGIEIRNALSGITLDGIYPGGTFFSETYSEDGSIRYHDANGADSGAWSVHGDAFCTFYDRQPGACFYVLSHGANCFTFRTTSDDAAGQSASGDAWAAEGWNRDRPASCPTAPAAEI